MPQSGTDVDSKEAQLSARVVPRMKTATVQQAHRYNTTDAFTNVQASTVVRDALNLYYLVSWSDLTDEVRDDLDPERLADEIVTIPEEYVERVASADVGETPEVTA